MQVKQRDGSFKKKTNSDEPIRGVAVVAVTVASLTAHFTHCTDLASPYKSPPPSVSSSLVSAEISSPALGTAAEDTVGALCTASAFPSVAGSAGRVSSAPLSTLLTLLALLALLSLGSLLAADVLSVGDGREGGAGEPSSTLYASYMPSPSNSSSALTLSSAPSLPPPSAACSISTASPPPSASGDNCALGADAAPAVPAAPAAPAAPAFFIRNCASNELPSPISSSTATFVSNRTRSLIVPNRPPERT